MAIVVNYLVGEPETVGYSNTVPMFQTKSQPGTEEGPRQSSGGGPVARIQLGPAWWIRRHKPS